MDILEKIDKVLNGGFLKEGNDSSTPSKEEMIQYLLDSNALFHHDEGTRRQWETMGIKDLKVYYDDYKASE